MTIEMLQMRPAFIKDVGKIFAAVDKDTNEKTYAEVLSRGEDFLELRYLENTVINENIILDFPVFLNRNSAEIPIQYFNHMPAQNEVIVLENGPQLYVADVTHVVLESGTVHIQERVHTATASQHERFVELKKMLLRNHRAYTVHQLAVLRGTTPEEAQKYIDGQMIEHTVFTVDNQGITLYPAFLFDIEGNVDKTMAQLVKVFENKFSGWEAWAWFCLPTGLLSGGVPKDMAYLNYDRAFTATTRKKADLDNNYY